MLLLLLADDRPIARNLVYHVAPGTEEVITFKGFNRDGASVGSRIDI